MSSDPIADLGSGVSGSAVGEVLCYEAFLDACRDGLADGLSLLHEAEGVLEHHGSGENCRERVGDVLASGLRIGAVDWLKEAGVEADACGSEETHGACDDAGLVGEDVAEGVLGDEDIEELGHGDDLHGRIVDKHIVSGDIGVLGSHLLSYLAPETRGLEDIGLIDHGEVFAATLRVLESEFEDTLNLLAAVDIGIVGRIAVVAATLLAEIHTASELTDAEELGTVDELGFEWGLVDEALVGLHGAEVGVEAELLTHGEKTVLRTDLGCWVVVEARIAYRTEEDGVALEADLESILGEGIARGIDGASTDEAFGESGLVTEFLANGIDSLDSLVDDFGTDAVAWEECDVEFHLVIVFFGTTYLR